MPEIVIAQLVFLAHIDELAKVLREQKIQCPIEGDSDLLFQSRQFAQVDRAPHPPGDKPRDIDAKDAGHAGAVTDGRKLADGFEVEFLELSSIGIRDDVLGYDRALPKSMLRSWRTELSGAEIRNQGAIAQGPYARPIWNSQFCGHLHPAALNLAWQCRNERVRHSPGSPDQGPGRYHLSLCQFDN